jgi:hypothetical protein
MAHLELLSKLSQADDDERYENESTKDGGGAILTDQQTPEVTQPAEEPLHLHGTEQVDDIPEHSTSELIPLSARG